MNRERLEQIIEEYKKSPEDEKQFAISSIDSDLKQEGFSPVEVNGTKPWGGYVRLANDNAEQFINTFFPSISYEDAKLGNPEAELSPKILVVEPGKRLSWQKHDRRAECWTFLTDGTLYRSDDDEQGEKTKMNAGDFVQLKAGERHRLVGDDNELTIVAEIWQHTDKDNLSNEDDIVRIQDDFQR